MKRGKFQDAPELIESLSEDERQSLVEIVNRRLVEQRREELAQNIVEAREDHKRGKVRRGAVEDLLRDLRK